MLISLRSWSERLMSMSELHVRWMWYRRKVGKMNINNGVSIHYNHSCLLLRICAWVYGDIDTRFPPLLISSIYDFSIVENSFLIARNSCSPWVVEPLFSLVYGPSLSWLIFFPLLYIPSTIAFIFRSIFLPVIWALSLPTLLSNMLEN